MKISKAKQSVIAIAAGLLLISWLKHSMALLVAAGAIGITFPFSFLNNPIHKVWMGISKILGTISSHVILFILFYLFLTPISLLRKIIQSKDSMTDFPGKKTSSFTIKNHQYSKKDFLNPW